MAEANCPRWIVLRCEPKIDTDGNIRKRIGRYRVEGGGLDWREGNFPRESHKTD